jgi:hypothetical protein
MRDDQSGFGAPPTQTTLSEWRPPMVGVVTLSVVEVTTAEVVSVETAGVVSVGLDILS